MSVQQVIKEASELYGDLLLGGEFMDKFYSIFLTLSPSSETRFKDLEKQKKAFHGMMSVLLQMGEEKDVHERLITIRRTHQHMKISQDEFTAFFNGISVALRWAAKGKTGDKNAKVLKQVLEYIKKLQDFFLAEQEPNKCNII